MPLPLHLSNKFRQRASIRYDQVGFQYRWNEKANEWSHASAAIMISPEGKITRYLHGVDFDARDMKLALNETANGKVGNILTHHITDF